MDDAECVTFLQWALPRLNLRWQGFRRVRRQVCKRIARRMSALSCGDVAAYRRYLEEHDGEWAALDAFCRITVTRFYRDRRAFAMLVHEVLPDLARAARARGAATLRIWCAGCASGEEPYTLAIGWRLELAERFPDLCPDLLATDADDGLLARAAEACYAWSAVKDLPAAWRTTAFRERDGRLCLDPDFGAAVRFLRHDLRTPLAESGFDLICCRNLAFTYFDAELQARTAQAIHDRLLPGGVLMLGIHERLPPGGPDLQALDERLAFYRKPVPAGTGPGPA